MVKISFSISLEMSFKPKNYNIDNIWTLINQYSETSDESIWGQLEFHQILAKIRQIHDHAKLISKIIPDNVKVKANIRLIWGGKDWNTLIFIVPTSLDANQLRYLKAEIESQLLNQLNFIPVIKIEVRRQQWSRLGIPLSAINKDENLVMTKAEADQFINDFINDSPNSDN